MNAGTPSGRIPAASALRRSRPDRHLCVVSHRLPVTYTPDLGWERSPGGLVSALDPALRDRPALWFGHANADDPDPPPGRGKTQYRVLRLGRERSVRAIDGACNRSLWPALHGIVERIEQDDSWWAAYADLAATNARHIATVAPSGSIVWVHDYHHILLADELRRRRPDLRLGFFFHTPVDAAGLAELHIADRLATALGRYHVVGTQTPGDADEVAQFVESHGGDLPPTLRSIPVGFDVARWSEFRNDPVVDALARRHGAPGGLLAVGVDRADYTKGLPTKLVAIERLLDDGRLHPDEFRLVQIATRTRAGIGAYDEMLAEIRRSAARVNEAHRRSDGEPVVRLITEPHPPREVAALMRASDMALVTPIRDGMNLVAFEYAALNADRPTALVLGQGAGA
ncbi:MAG: hypothetical protein HKN44_11265, partial [Ilumatobacter sp.]|nr:hypothetical protein [Ilumatobacter sp.]